MRLFSLIIPKTLEAAVGVCRRFALAAGLSALLNTLYLDPPINTLQVYDRVVPIGDVQTLPLIAVVVGWAVAALTALNRVQAGSGFRGRARGHAARTRPKNAADTMRAWGEWRGIQP